MADDWRDTNLRGPGPLPILGTAGHGSLASCRACRATVVAIPPEDGDEPALLVDPHGVHRAILTSIHGPDCVVWAGPPPFALRAHDCPGYARS